MNTRTWTLVAAAFALALFYGCGKSTPAPETPPAEPPAASEPIPGPASEPGAAGGVAESSSSSEDGPFISVQGRKFIDAEGRQIVLHGMSVISKDRKSNYQSWHGPEEFALMREWGMNCIRLGIIWDGLEPEPGAFDEEYLKKVDERIAWAGANGIHVFIDMHQDLFSVLYSDGAPEWATLTDGKPHIHEGAVWSDAYFTSPAVQAAFDNFWANKPCEDGVGVQDHFARAWRHVAERYKDNSTVLGYDLFNEPNMGARSPEAQLKSILKLAQILAEKEGGDPPDPMTLAGQWLDPEGRSKLMELLGDIQVYKQVIAEAQDIYQEFERTQVTPMFQRVANAIREVDPNHIIFLETSMSANMGIYTGIEPINGPDGTRDPLQAYAPHGYDIVVDTPDLSNASNERVELIFARHGESAERLHMPMLIGEWGAFGGAGPEIVPTARFVVRQFEKLLCSDTYWEFGRYVLDAPYRHILQRPIPQRVAGTLLAYETDHDKETFSCSWQEDPGVTAPSRIYIPAHVFDGVDSITLEPVGAGFTVEPLAEGSDNVIIVIAPTGEAVERRLTAQ